MASQLKDQLSDAVKAAMRAQQKDKLKTLRYISAQIKQVEVDTRETLDDNAVLALLDKVAKRLREAIKEFEQAGRTDLVEQENFALSVVEEFLPQPLTDAEIEQLVQDTITQLDAKGMQDMGAVMAQLKPQIQGRADGSVVSQKVKQILTQ